MDFTSKLKEHTLLSHQQLEKLLVLNLKQVSSVQDYLKILGYFYGYIAPLEQLIDRYIGVSELPDFEDRRKAGVLVRDIIQLGGNITLQEKAQVLPTITNKYQAFGALYVLEGSTLGGQIICKMLSSSLALEGKGLEYFSGYGALTQQKWDEFKNSLNSQNLSAESEQFILAAADDTFIKFRNWIEKHE